MVPSSKYLCQKEYNANLGKTKVDFTGTYHCNKVINLNILLLDNNNEFIKVFKTNYAWEFFINHYSYLILRLLPSGSNIMTSIILQMKDEDYIKVIKEVYQAIRFLTCNIKRLNKIQIRLLSLLGPNLLSGEIAIRKINSRYV